jgi:hypothetical protein
VLIRELLRQLAITWVTEKKSFLILFNPFNLWQKNFLIPGKKKKKSEGKQGSLSIFHLTNKRT